MFQGFGNTIKIELLVYTMHMVQVLIPMTNFISTGNHNRGMNNYCSPQFTTPIPQVCFPASLVRDFSSLHYIPLLRSGQPYPGPCLHNAAPFTSHPLATSRGDYISPHLLVPVERSSPILGRTYSMSSNACPLPPGFSSIRFA